MLISKRHTFQTLMFVTITPSRCTIYIFAKRVRFVVLKSLELVSFKGTVHFCEKWSIHNASPDIDIVYRYRDLSHTSDLKMTEQRYKLEKNQLLKFFRYN